MKETSIESHNANMACGFTGKIKTAVMARILASTTPQTASEIAAMIPEHRINSINPRFAELETIGLIAPATARRCKITGKNCVTWKATGAEAIKPERAKRVRAEGRAKLLCRIQELKDENAILMKRLERWGRPTNSRRLEKALNAREDTFSFLKEITVAP